MHQFTSNFHESIQTADPDVHQALQGELNRQSDQIELIASENLVSRAVLQAQGSVMTNKTVEGYPQHRYYGGAEFADQIESIAITRACKLFGCNSANVQPHSGSNANQAVYLACLKPGDTILSMDIAAGGHISHGHPATQTGRFYNILSYGLTRDEELIDYQAAEFLAEKHRPKMIIAGGSAYSRTIDFAALSRIAKKVEAVFLVDMAHFAGLVATGHYPNPFPHADIVTTTTYKSLRGARGGIILWNDQRFSSLINNGVFPGIQGSVLLHAVAAKAVCLGEALRNDFRDYNQQVIDNARALAQTLIAHGIRVVSNGTDTGLMLIDISSTHFTGDSAVNLLEQAGLTCNKNLIPFDTRPAEIASGLRLSVNAGTARGFDKMKFEQIGKWIATLLLNDPNQAEQLNNLATTTRQDVASLCKQFPIYTSSTGPDS